MLILGFPAEQVQDAFGGIDRLGRILGVLLERFLGDALDVGFEGRIGGSACDGERNGHVALLPDRGENVTGRLYRGAHLEIQRVLRTDGARTGEFPDRRRHHADVANGGALGRTVTLALRVWMVVRGSA